MSTWHHLLLILQRVPSLNKCKLLTLTLAQYQDMDLLPTVSEVERIIQEKGIVVNEDFWLRARDVTDHWREKILAMSPHIKGWQALQGESALDGVLSLPHSPNILLASFTTLSYLQLSSMLRWDQEVLNVLISSCPMLQELDLQFQIWVGAFTLTSQVLRKFSFKGNSPKLGCTRMQFNLPNLTHLTLHRVGNDILFVQQLLDGDPVIHLPQLRVLLIWRRLRSLVEIACKSGHSTLSQLTIKGGRDLTCINLQNLPCLRYVKLSELSVNTKLLFDVPGDCDIKISCIMDEEPQYRYSRERRSNSSNFIKQLVFNVGRISGWREQELEKPKSLLEVESPRWSEQEAENPKPMFEKRGKQQHKKRG